MSSTPRTDAEERWAEWNGNEFKVVHVEFARELELELAEMREALELALLRLEEGCDSADRAKIEAAIKKARGE